MDSNILLLEIGNSKYTSSKTSKNQYWFTYSVFLDPIKKWCFSLPSLVSPLLQVGYSPVHPRGFPFAPEGSDLLSSFFEGVKKYHFFIFPLADSSIACSSSVSFSPFSILAIISPNPDLVPCPGPAPLP